MAIKRPKDGRGKGTSGGAGRNKGGCNKGGKGHGTGGGQGKGKNREK